MKNFKSLISILLVFMTVIFCFTGCAKPPEEPAKTETTELEIKKADGAMIYNDEENIQFTETKNNVIFKLKTYYSFNENYASISNITVDNDTIGINANCYCDVTLIFKGKESDSMKIGFTAYDKNGEIVRDSFIDLDVKDVKNGKTVEGMRFDIPYSTASVVFKNFAD